MKDRERIERVRVGTATAALLNTSLAHKEDKTAFTPWDVFPELRPEEQQDDGSMKEIAAMFRSIAARQKARKAIPN